MRYQNLFEDENSVMPAPQRWLDPKNREYRPGLGDYAPGGKYLHMPAKQDVTGQSVARAYIDVTGGRPDFKVSNDKRDAATPRDGRLIKTNLFKAKAGWKWAEGTDPATAALATVVSVTIGNKHLYCLRADFPNGVTLARYADSKSEPRLRPTTYGNLEMGTPIGEIVVRGKIKHTVYDKITVR